MPSSSSADAESSDENWFHLIDEMVSSSSEDVAFFCLMLFGLSILAGGLVYILCRILCFDFWASCCFRFREKVTPHNSATKGESHKDLVKKIIMNGKKSDKDTWAKRRLSEDFTAGPEEDQIIYTTNLVAGNNVKRDSIFSQTLDLPDTYGRHNPWADGRREGAPFY